MLWALLCHCKRQSSDELLKYNIIDPSPRKAGAWGPGLHFSWVRAALKIAGSGADTAHQALPPAHLTFLLTSGSKPVGTVPRHCWWLPCSLGMLKRFPQVWTWRFTVCIAFKSEKILGLILNRKHGHVPWNISKNFRALKPLAYP